jgi:5S rRNA maturation endonuclease (ribonuclease M5)
MKEGGKVIIIRGIVIPVDWDERGTVIAAALSTHKEEEYLIDRDCKGREIIDHIQHEVEVRGVVRKSNNTYAISITSYKVICE